MDTAPRPSPHGKVEEIAKANGLSLTKHIVVLIYMENVARSRKRSLSKSPNPVHQGLVVMVHETVNGSICPREEVVESAQRVIEKTEVVQVDVQYGGHWSCPSLVTVGIIVFFAKSVAQAFEGLVFWSRLVGVIVPQRKVDHVQ